MVVTFARLSVDVVPVSAQTLADAPRGLLADESQPTGLDVPLDAELLPLSAFAELELHSTLFEQHYAQDVRTGTGALAALGAPADRRRLAERLQSGRLTARLIQVVAAALASAGGAEASGAAVSSPDASRSMRRPCDDFPEVPWSSQLTTTADQLATALQESGNVQLLWVHVHPTGSEGIGATAVSDAGCVVPRLDPAADERLLRTVLQWRSQLADARRGGLLVTGLRGAGRRVAPPFGSLFVEDEVRLPLWVDAGGGEFSRVTLVTGSQDVLPTLLDLVSRQEMSCGEPAAQAVASAAGPVDDAAAEQAGPVPAVPQLPLPSAPRSLLEFCGAPGTACARTLWLRTDDAEALRSPDFLFVRCRAPVATADELTGADAPSEVPAAETRYAVYRKPEDVWNVNEQSVVYEALLADVEAHWPSAEAAESESVA